MSELPGGEITNIGFRIEAPGERHVVRVDESIPWAGMSSVNQPADARPSWIQVRCVRQSVPW